MNTNKQGMKKETKKQMNFDMTQFGATQNQKQAQAQVTTLLWGKYITCQPCLETAFSMMPGTTNLIGFTTLNWTKVMRWGPKDLTAARIIG